MSKKTMRIVNRTRRTLVGDDVRLVDTWVGRLRGYLGSDRPRRGQGILLFPCRAVHTFGMRFPLDVIFLDPEGRVLEVTANLSPGTRSGPVKEAQYVLEVPPGTIEDTQTRVGDEMSWSTAPPTSDRYGQTSASQGRSR